MPLSELHDRIHCWLWLYEHTPFPPSTDAKVVRFNESAHQRWRREMLLDVIAMSIPEELEGPSIADNLRSAIQFAQSGDGTMIQRIAGLLKKVFSISKG